MPVLDQFGRPMETVPPAQLLERQAVASFGSVRQIQSGHPADGLTPVRLAAILREAETGDATAYLELAEQMEEKDLHYAAVLGVRKRAIRSLTLQVDPGDDSAAADEAADMVRQTLAAAPVKSALIDMMDALGKSYSVSEIHWERAGRGLKVASIEQVDPRWFEFDQENGRHIYLRDNAGPQPLRPDSYIIHMAKAKSGLP
ncbi:MAG: phage portal protein family protein, partial [Phaeobacter italicus]